MALLHPEQLHRSLPFAAEAKYGAEQGIARWHTTGLLRQRMKIRAFLSFIIYLLGTLLCDAVLHTAFLNECKSGFGISKTEGKAI